MTTNTDPVRALADELQQAAAGEDIPSAAAAYADCAGRLRTLAKSLASAPPSAPVGPYTYASTQATTCAGCGEHKHTPLRIDAMGGYVCLSCIDQKLGGLLGEFGYPPSAPTGVEWNDEAAWSLAARAEASGAERDSDDSGTWWTLRIEHFNALAQQPAAPSGEAVGEYVRATVTALERIGEDQAVVAGVDTSALADKGRSLLAAPQQPAGVDEAAAVLADLHPFLFGLKLAAPNEEKRAFIQERIDAVRRASAALAAQQQGGA